VAAEQREVTLLFADLRGSSELANSLGIERTCEVMDDVMDVLASAVMDLDGLVIDFFGDGLAAMWNAPADQPEHAELACRAALRIVERLQAVQKKWSHVLSTELRLGIGVHTGVAQVGNVGSSRWAKYGPRGANVNLAHRVEAAAKAVGVPIVVTAATVARLSSRLQTTRICRAQLTGVESAVDLFSIRKSNADAARGEELAAYGRALELFEAGEYEPAAECLAKVHRSNAEMPVDFLSKRIEKAIALTQRRRSTDEAPIGPVIALTVK
jgi:adenylate cyclase